MSTIHDILPHETEKTKQHTMYYDFNFFISLCAFARVLIEAKKRQCIINAVHDRCQQKVFLPELQFYIVNFPQYHLQLYYIELLLNDWELV